MNVMHHEFSAHLRSLLYGHKHSHEVNDLVCGTFLCNNMDVVLPFANRYLCEICYVTRLNFIITRCKVLFTNKLYVTSSSVVYNRENVKKNDRT